MSVIYLLHYNNYYNRIVKKEDDINDYLVSPYLIETLSNVNFNPNDGVDTELIIGAGTWDKKEIPDYLIEWNDTDDYSRWFVLECSRTRSGQYKLTLHRDVIVDRYDDIINTPCFIDKGTVSDSDIAIFNKESYIFNSIKSDELALNDDVGVPWIVGYISKKDLETTTSSITGDVYFPVNDAMLDYPAFEDTDAYFDQFSTLNKTSAGTNKYTVRGDLSEVRIHWNVKDSTDTGYSLTSAGTSIDNRYQVIEQRTSPGYAADDDYILFLSHTDLRASMANANMQNNIKNAFTQQLTDARYEAIIGAIRTEVGNNTSEAINAMLEDDGKIIKCGSKYYIIQAQKDRAPHYATTVVTTSNPTLYNTMTDVKDGIVLSSYNYHFGSNTSEGFDYSYSTYDYNFQLVEIGNSVNIKYEIPTTAVRRHLTDAPYDMFCMPFNDRNMSYYVDTTESSFISSSNKYLNLAAAQSILADLIGVGFVYDVQLLPYCPLPEQNLNADKNIMTLISPTQSAFPHGKIKISTGGQDTILGIIMFCNQSTFETEIPIDWDKVAVTDIKQQHQTDNWRFNSPNWAASYDFDVTMNRGLDYVDVDCTYKPYNPYIHLCPRFNGNGLYGYNNNDATGLICSGDFSISAMTDQWKTYEYQNKNYQNIFDRQIQNMETTQHYGRIQNGISALAGTFTGAASGGLVGNVLGGGKGNVAGAAIGGALSLGAGIADMYIQDKLNQESRSYAKDVFNYQIDNIKSLPQTLTKVSAFNKNNKLIPFIEYYTCTDEEKNIFNNLIKWNGMTVNRIDTIANFIGNDKNFIRGRLVRLEIEDDTHMLQAIANELAQGVFI